MLTILELTMIAVASRVVSYFTKQQQEEQKITLAQVISEKIETSEYQILPISSDEILLELQSELRQKEKLQISYENELFEAVYDVVEQKYQIGNNNYFNNSPLIQGENNTVGSNKPQVSTTNILQGESIMVINNNVIPI